MTPTEAQRQWDDTVYAKAKRVDDSDKIDWLDMAYGFFLALGFKPGRARQLAWKAKGVSTP